MFIYFYCKIGIQILLVLDRFYEILLFTNECFSFFFFLQSVFQIFALRQLEPSTFQKYVTHFIRGISLVMIPIAATVPTVSVPALSNSIQTLSDVSVYRV